MKKALFSIMAVAALLAGASCSKDEPSKVNEEQGYTIAASFDRNEISKTTIGMDNMPEWVLNDKVWISVGDPAVETPVVGEGEVVAISASGVATIRTSIDITGDKAVYAVYPYRVNPGTDEMTPDIDRYPYCVNQDGTVSIDIPTEQSGEFKDANICAAKGNQTKGLSFKNATTLLKVSSKISAITKFELDADNIAGKVQFTYDASNPDVTAGDQDRITVVPTGSAPYYIAVAAGISYSAGSTIAAYYKTGADEPAYTKTTKNGLSLTRSRIYNLGFAGPSDVVPGDFTINENGDKVCFSTGNLYCKRTSSSSSDWTWHFYDKQYGRNTIPVVDYGRTAKASDTEIDLFCWSYDATKSIDPVANYFVFQQSSFKDWGETMPGGWRTLTEEEWVYIVYAEYKDHNTNTYKPGKLRQGIRVCMAKVCGVNGVLLFPDGWEVYKDYIKQYNLMEPGGSWDTNTFNETTTPSWKDMENSGVVFLPAAGARTDGVSVNGVNRGGNYWSSTNKQWQDEVGCCFTLAEVGVLDPEHNKISAKSAYTKSYGISVRLVKDL